MSLNTPGGPWRPSEIRASASGPAKGPRRPAHGAGREAKGRSPEEAEAEIETNQPDPKHPRRHDDKEPRRTETPAEPSEEEGRPHDPPPLPNQREPSQPSAPEPLRPGRDPTRRHTPDKG